MTLGRDVTMVAWTTPLAQCARLPGLGQAAMRANRTRSALLLKLESLRRGVDLIRRTRSREESRVMLSGLLRDLHLLDRLELDLLSPQESDLLEELRDTTKELRQRLSKSPSSPAKRWNRTNGTPVRSTT